MKGCHQTVHRWGKPCPVHFTRIDGNHTPDRNQDIAGLAAKPGFEFDEIITQLQRAGCVETDVQHDLTIVNKLARHLH